MLRAGFRRISCLQRQSKHTGRNDRLRRRGSKTSRCETQLCLPRAAAKVASQPETVRKIEATERAWVAYRDPISKLPTRQKTKPPNTAPSIRSTWHCCAPSSRSVRSPHSKIWCSTTRPNSESDSDFEVIVQRQVRRLSLAGSKSTDRLDTCFHECARIPICGIEQ